MNVRPILPRFASRYSFPVDINQASPNDLTADLAESRVWHCLSTHWNSDASTTTITNLSGRRQTLSNKPGTFYVESGVLKQPDSWEQKALGICPAWLREKLEAAVDRVVEGIFKKHNID